VVRELASHNDMSMDSRDEPPSPRPTEVHAWLQALFEESPLAIGFSRDGVTLDANPAYVRLFGYDGVAELRGGAILAQIAPSHRAQIEQMVAQRARGEQLPHRYESRGLRRDGTEFPLEVTTTRVAVLDGPLTIAFLSDLSEREDALLALRASEERFRTLSGAAYEGVFLHANGKIVLANDAGAAMYGFDAASMIGVALMELTAPESRALVLEHIQSQTSHPYEGFARRKNGSIFVAEVRGRTLFHQGCPTRVTVIRDVTERRREEAEQRVLAERVRHAQKLEGLGMLAGGVAHDFNNILAVITNGVALVKRDAAIGPTSAAHLETIAVAAERAADLCRQMLAYAGKTAFTRVEVDISSLVAEMASMLEVSVAKKATLVRDLAPGLPALLGDATQIRQVVMNLVLNASEAIGAARGTVRVATGAGTYGAEVFARSAAGGDPKGGAYVYLEVQDDGVGMDGPTVAQMFDPFFSTKFMGRGLGMAAVLGIVRGHAGAIDVESAPEKGTRIRIYLPASAGERPRATSRPAVELRGEGVVLLVDDEKTVRLSTRLLLEDFGFEVIVACDGVEAVELFRREAGRIGAVLLDLTMPRMDGVETLRELRRIAPEVPVVLTSGYGTAPIEPLQGGPEAVFPDAVLAKPYPADRLVGTLLEVMRSR
jgi:two-component system, cell cycle sensor histidine kinase and response regulator CckA